MKSVDQTLPIPPLKGGGSPPLRGSQRGSVELLSPARNLECGIAAIDHGADAVYIGASRFGARAAAGNSTEDIAKLCDYAHRFGAKVYVTVNTLLYEEEKEEARLLICDLYRIGADALIVQDMALLGMDLPPIPLHASTQMDNRTAEKVAKLKELGFRQIVLARELSLEEIRSIHEAVPDVNLEVFVHGALCVSYSGRCYASEHCFGRSANRGECAQFCRLPFSLQDARGRTLIRDKYLLSLRDMNRIENLEEMLDAGVRSFKIEGRLKDIAYVKNVTAAYRQELDSILQRRPEFVRSSFGTSTYTFKPDLSRSFSRGSTDYFLFGRTNDLASPDTPKSRGREVGYVKEVRGGCIIVSSSETFTNGDGLCFFDQTGRLQGFRVNRAEGNKLYPRASKSPDPSRPPLKGEERKSPFKGDLEGLSPLRGGREGSVLWRSYDKQWEDQMSGKTAERRIAARFLLEDTEQGFRLTFSADDGTRRSKDFPAEHQPARTDQTASIRDVLSKLGDTPYSCSDIEVRFSQPWFIPRSTLAEWRRQTSEELRVKSEELRVKSEELRVKSEELRVKSEELRVKNNSNQPDASNSDSSLFTLHSSLSTLHSSLSTLHSSLFTLHSSLSTLHSSPGFPLMTCRFCIRHAWGQCKKEKPGGWEEPLYLVLGDGRRFRLRFDCRKCEMTVNAE